MPTVECRVGTIHSSILTGIPTVTSRSRYSAFQFARRKQPCDLGAAHVFGLRRAVNAVARQVQSNPRRAHGVVGPRRQLEFGFQVARFRRFRKILRAEHVIGIGRNHRDAQVTDGPLLDALRDAARKVRQQPICGIEHLQHTIPQADLNPGSFGTRHFTVHSRNNQFRSRRNGVPINRWIQAAEQIRMGVMFLCHQFQQRFIIKPRLLGLGQPGRGQWQQAREVCQFNTIILERRLREREQRSGVGVQRPARHQALPRLKRPQGRACL